MSRGDILVLVNEDCPESRQLRLGDLLIVEIELPANHVFGPKCMQCQTSVVRISHSESGSLRLALRIHKMRFQSCGDSAPTDGWSDEKEEVRPLLM